MGHKVNCIIVDDEVLAREIIATHLLKIERINVVAHCSHALEAFTVIQKFKIDLIFLDINMPETSGISFAKSINQDIKIIFTTAYRDYAVEGFELRAVDYLLKPISFERLKRAVNNFFESYRNEFNSKVSKLEDTQRFLFLRSDRQMVKINYDNIIYIESLSDYIKVHTNERSIMSRENISKLNKILPDNEFLRIHRSYIVSIKQIESYTSDSITISGKNLSISRSYKNKVLTILGSI